MWSLKNFEWTLKKKRNFASKDITNNRPHDDMQDNGAEHLLERLMKDFTSRLILSEVNDKETLMSTLSFKRTHILT